MECRRAEELNFLDHGVEGLALLCLPSLCFALLQCCPKAVDLLLQMLLVLKQSMHLLVGLAVFAAQLLPLLLVHSVGFVHELSLLLLVLLLQGSVLLVRLFQLLPEQLDIFNQLGYLLLVSGL